MIGANFSRLAMWAAAAIFLSGYCLLVTAETSLSLRITPTEITAGITQNVSLRCERHGTSAAISDEMWWFRIAKKTSEDWVNIADYRMDGSIVNTMGTKAAGFLNPRDWLGYLQVNWEEATEETFGIFRCEFFGVTSNSWFAADKSPEVIVTETMNADTLVHFWNDINVESGNLASCLGYSGSETNKFQEKIARLGRNIDQYVTATNDKSSVTNDTLWKRGSYSLLMPETGCPAQFMNDTESWVKFHEESSSSRACLQRNNNLHLSKPIDEVDGSNCFLHLRFCKSLEEHEEVPWPDGRYCINKIRDNTCPVGFSDGSLDLDGEDNNYGAIVAGHTSSYGKIDYYYCCKSRGSHNTPMILPTEKPFYLYRYGGECQKVQGMTETQEYIDIDTEDDVFNHDEAADYHPDVDISSGKPTRIHLCYYKKSN